MVPALPLHSTQMMDGDWPRTTTVQSTGFQETSTLEITDG